MTPHEVVKDSLEKFEERFKDSFSGGDMNEWERAGPIIEHLKSSHLSLLLSIKEMVDKQYDTCIYNGRQFRIENETTRVLDNLQSLLDEEINKVKEL